ncbi:MAG TPA: LptF/LptG family permease [Opitutus sp.]|nr:LptF/LptG family permease [Opitutus sp.]
MSLLDRYIFRSVLFTCAAAVALFTFVLTFGNVIKDLLAHVLAGQLPFWTVVRLVTLWVPSMIIYALPMGILTGVLLTLGRLSADTEITAMRASGISLRRIARPILLLASLGTALGIYFNFESMPQARVTYEREFAAAIQANPLGIIIPKTFIRDFPGRVIYVREKHGGLLRNIWYWELDNQRRVIRVVRAESGHIDYDQDDNEFILTLSHVTAESRDDKNPEDFTKSPLVGTFEQSAPIHLSLERFFGRASHIRVKQEWLTYSEIQHERAKLAAQPMPSDPSRAKQQAREQMTLELVYQDKFNTALAVLSMALIGIPLGIRVSRRESFANLAVAIALAIAYYLLIVAVKMLDRHPEYRPDLLLWVPNLLLIAGGLWLLLRVDKK